MNWALLSGIAFWTLLALVIGQGLLVFGFSFVLVRNRRQAADRESFPKAAVILCLRGVDPFLGRCLAAVQSQEYPDYEVQIVIDHESDEAARFVQQHCQINSASRLRIHYLAERRSTCSLKCSSIVQAVSSLDETFGFIAQLDADTIPHPGWLRELAIGLSDDRTGAVTGNRWYMPAEPSWGALVRYLWNSAAIVQMYWYRIAWGGTLAIKLDAIKQANLLERWSKAFCEDTMLYSQLARCGYRVAFAPSLIMVNRELCDIRGFFHWVRRQMLTAKLYHPGWTAVVGHAVLTTVLPIAVLGLLVVGLATSNRPVVLWSAAGVMLYEMGMALLLLSLEFAVRSVVGLRGEPTDWIDRRTLIRLPFALILTQVNYAHAMASLVWLREVDWRGIKYDVQSSWNIRMLKYEPFGQQGEQGHSL